MQHLADQLDYNLTPIEFMQSQFPEDFKDFELARNAIGRFGVTGKMQVRNSSAFVCCSPHQTMPLKNLSEGQCCRLIFAWISHTVRAEMTRASC